MKREIPILGLISLILFLSLSATATMVIPLNVKQMSARAEKIFVGNCREVSEEIDENGLAVRYATFDVEQVLKGPVSKTEVLKFYGVSQKRMVSLNFNVGDHEVLFLYKDSRLGFTSAVGWGQGRFDIIDGPVPAVVNRFYRDWDTDAENSAELPALRMKSVTEALDSRPITLDSLLKTIQKEIGGDL